MGKPQKRVSSAKARMRRVRIQGKSNLKPLSDLKIPSTSEKSTTENIIDNSDNSLSNADDIQSSEEDTSSSKPEKEKSSSSCSKHDKQGDPAFSELISTLPQAPATYSYYALGIEKYGINEETANLIIKSWVQQLMQLKPSQQAHALTVMNHTFIQETTRALQEYSNEKLNSNITGGLPKASKDPSKATLVEKTPIILTKPKRQRTYLRELRPKPEKANIDIPTLTERPAVFVAVPDFPSEIDVSDVAIVDVAKDPLADYDHHNM